MLSYGGRHASTHVRDLVHGAIFTRGPKDLHNTAIFIGGTDMTAGEQLLAAVQKTFFGPLRVSVMLDSNGSNTTAVAAVAKLVQTIGDVRGRRAVVVAGTGPVGTRAAGLLARAGARVAITSRHADGGEARGRPDIGQRFGGSVEAIVVSDPSQRRHRVRRRRAAAQRRTGRRAARVARRLDGPCRRCASSPTSTPFRR